MPRQALICRWRDRLGAESGDTILVMNVWVTPRDGRLSEGGECDPPCSPNAPETLGCPADGPCGRASATPGVVLRATHCPEALASRQASPTVERPGQPVVAARAGFRAHTDLSTESYASHPSLAASELSIVSPSLKEPPLSRASWRFFVRHGPRQSPVGLFSRCCSWFGFVEESIGNVVVAVFLFARLFAPFFSLRGGTPIHPFVNPPAETGSRSDCVEPDTEYSTATVSQTPAVSIRTTLGTRRPSPRGHSDWPGRLRGPLPEGRADATVVLSYLFLVAFQAVACLFVLYLSCPVKRSRALRGRNPMRNSRARAGE